MDCQVIVEFLHEEFFGNSRVTCLCYAGSTGVSFVEETTPSNIAPAITSFVIRFVHLDRPDQMASQPDSAPDGLTLRGTILHVQTNQEISFTRWEDAVTFIRRFVPLNAPNPNDAA